MAIEPLDPKKILPKEPEESAVQEDDMIEIPEEDPKPVAPPPDISHHMKKINAALAKPWQQNEFRCGRSYIIGNDFNVEEIKEVVRTFSSADWEVKVSKEKRGLVI